MNKHKKIDILLDKNNHDIEVRLKNRREIHDFSSEMNNLKRTDRIFLSKAIFESVKAYPIAAYYTNLLNGLLNKDFTLRQEPALYQKEIGSEIFKSEKFLLIESYDVISDKRLSIELLARSKISSIINEFLSYEETISTDPKNVANYIKGKSKVKLDKFIKVNTFFNIDEENKNLFRVKRLMITELIEDSYSYMDSYLKSQDVKNKYNEMLMFGSFMSSNPLFIKAFLHIATDKKEDLSPELAGAFLLSLKYYNVPILKMVKEEYRDILSNFITKNISKLKNFLTEAQMYEIDYGLAMSFSTKKYMLSNTEIMNNQNNQIIYERVKNFFENLKTISEIVWIDKQKEKYINTLKLWKENFDIKYQINHKGLKEIITHTSLYESYDEDIVLNIGNLFKDALKLNQSNLSKNIVLKTNISNSFKEMGFLKNTINMVIFDKSIEIFLETCLKTKFPNVSVKSMSNILEKKEFSEIIEYCNTGKINNILMKPLVENYTKKDHILEIEIPYEEKEKIEEVEVFLNSVLSMQVILMKKALKDTKKIFDKGLTNYPEEYESLFLIINTMETLMNTFESSIKNEITVSIHNEFRAYELNKKIQNNNSIANTSDSIKKKI